MIARRLALYAAALVALAFTSWPAWAQPYKCTVDGRTVYQQAPCIGAVAVNISGAGRADPNSPAAQQVSREIAEMRYREKADKAARSGQVFVGMRQEDVLRTWGRPNRVTETTTAAGTTDHWFWARGRYSRSVHTSNGVVIAVQAGY